MPQSLTRLLQMKSSVTCSKCPVYLGNYMHLLVHFSFNAGWHTPKESAKRR